MKKMVFGVLVVVVFFGLIISSCTPSVKTASEATKTAEEQTAETKPVEKIHWKFLNAVPYAEPYYKEVLDPYMAEHPEQSYEFSSVGWDEFYGRFSAAAAGKAEIDIIWLDGSIVRNLMKSNVLMDITDKVGDTSVFKLDHPGYIYLKDGRLYGLALGPLEFDGIYYNKDIFKQYGLALPETYDDMLAVAKILRQNGIQPMVRPGTPSFWWSPTWAQILTQLVDNQPQYIDDLAVGKRKFTDSEAVEAVRWIKKLDDDGIWADDIEAIDDVTSYSLFVTGKVAMYNHGTYALPMLLQSAGTAKMPDIGVIHWPYMTPEKRLFLQYYKKQ